MSIKMANFRSAVKDISMHIMLQNIELAVPFGVHP
jgi:hypothetical protein